MLDCPFLSLCVCVKLHVVSVERVDLAGSSECRLDSQGLHKVRSVEIHGGDVGDSMYVCTSTREPDKRTYYSTTTTRSLLRLGGTLQNT